MDWVEKLHTTFFVEVNDGKTGTLAAVKTGEAKLKWVCGRPDKEDVLSWMSD